MLKEKPHYFEHRERLRRHYQQGGCDVLRDYEILELVLFYAIPRREVKEIAKQLLKKFGSLRGVLEAPSAELQSIKGISRNSTILIKLIRDIIPLYLKERTNEKPQVSCTTELLDYWRARLGALREEHIYAIYLNAKNMVLGVETLGEGTVTGVLIQPRRVIEGALKQGAAAFILVHNHPSGVVTPSADDIEITKKLLKVGKALDISLHDHIIISRDQHFSFREYGIL